MFDTQKFAEFMDAYIYEHEVEVMISLPKDTLIPEIVMNHELGTLAELYVMMLAMKEAILNVINEIEPDHETAEVFTDDILSIVKDDTNFEIIGMYSEE